MTGSPWARRLRRGPVRHHAGRAGLLQPRAVKSLGADVYLDVLNQSQPRLYVSLITFSGDGLLMIQWRWALNHSYDRMHL